MVRVLALGTSAAPVSIYSTLPESRHEETPRID
jgi:hypothetical protein